MNYRMIALSEDCRYIRYYGAGRTGCLAWAPDMAKEVEIAEILDIRTGWNTDNFNKHRSRGRATFLNKCREELCFSIIFHHPHFFQVRKLSCSDVLT